MIQFNVMPNPEFAENFIAPTRATEHSAAFDIYAQQDMTLTAVANLFDLGFSASYDEEYAAFLLPRSGHGTKLGTQMANTLGLIDADYRGKWMAGLFLNGRGTQLSVNDFPSVEDFIRDASHTFKRGERILQVVFFKKEDAEVNVVTSLDETERGSGGFGHSGN